MKYIHVAGASLNQTPLDFRHNIENIKQAIFKAKEREIALLCLPELAISGYGCEDAFFSPYVVEQSLKGLEEIIQECENITVTVGLPIEYAHSLFNVVAVIRNKELIGLVAKQELPGDGIYYEPRWFKPWKENQAVEYIWNGKVYPLGDLIIEIDGIRLGMEICEDAWNGIRPAQRHYLHNVDVIINPSASNFAFGKTYIRERLVTEASRAYNCTYIYSNLLGNEAGRIIYDGEILISQSGKLLARNRRFTYDDYVILSCVLDVEAVQVQRKKSFNFDFEAPPHLIQVEGKWKLETAPSKTEIASYETKEEELYLAETLALFDYMRKSRSRGFMLSLSGGADSSACAVLCAYAILRAYHELGYSELGKKLSYLKLVEAENLVSQFLTCVYQSTANSGEATLESAHELSLGLGAEFHHWEVKQIHESYLQLAEKAIARDLDWTKDDLALQNIQARLRSPGIWMLTNIKGSLLITTSNRSEAAVGYATMDGDTSGGLAPLGGVDKNTLLHWLKWAEHALEIPALKYVNQLKPTAELRPSTFKQSDEDDLMPYDILDEIEGLAIRDYKSPLDVFISLRGRYPDAQLGSFIRKFFTLWARNQWKRERYAPSFHMDDKNLDPKTWCRFPILSGGYELALKEMDEFIKSSESSPLELKQSADT